MAVIDFASPSNHVKVRWDGLTCVAQHYVFQAFVERILRGMVPCWSASPHVSVLHVSKDHLQKAAGASGIREELTSAVIS